MPVKALVLVVDDDAPIRELVREFLQHDGHDVIEAASAEEALEKIDESIPDILLCDMKMPKMNGLTLTRRRANSTHHSRPSCLPDTADIELEVRRLYLR